jgi:hypothetical protein
MGIHSSFNNYPDEVPPENGFSDGKFMKITTITVTGADDSVCMEDIAKISEIYPLVEFGILLSRKRQGSCRFPSREWLKSLKSLPENVRFSGHICGEWVREIFSGKWPVMEFEELLGIDFFSRFKRWQLNTHGVEHDWNSHFLKFLSQIPGTVIFQYDGQNRYVLNAAKALGISNIAALFDLSHGSGSLPDAWPKKLDGIPCGYAGGLSPENVSRECHLISLVTADSEIWIDAETKLRSDDDRYFEMGKVQDFVNNARPYSL